MRTVDATLLAAMAAGKPLSYFKGYVGYRSSGWVLFSDDCLSYRLTGQTLEFELPTNAGFAGDQTGIWLERGLYIAGTLYKQTTSRFYIHTQEYLPNGNTRFRGGIFPNQYYSAAGDVTYETLIDAMCSYFALTTTYKDDTELWLDYQFFPDATNLVLTDAFKILPLLAQKRLIQISDNEGQDVRIYSADVMGASVVTVPVADEWSAKASMLYSRKYAWFDELNVKHTDGTATYPVHNLGYLESTDDPPVRHTSSYEIDAYIRPDLRIQDGDVATLSMLGGTANVTFFARVIEEFNRRSTKLPKWRLRLQANPVFGNAEGSTLPQDVADIGNFIPVNTSNFRKILTAEDSNIQTALDNIDLRSRETLFANRTYYVRTDGSDSNDGLAATAAGAFLTIQHAIDVAAALDTSIYNVTINLQDNVTFVEGAITCKNILGSGSVGIVGPYTTTCIVDGGFVKSTPGTTYDIKGFALVKSATSPSAALWANNGAYIRFRSLDFGSYAGVPHIIAQTGGYIILLNNYTISGGASYHMASFDAGKIYMASRTITLSGVPAFSSPFAAAGGPSFITATGLTFAGTGATGVKYSAVQNSVINTGGGGANYFPGNVAGGTATGGQYV